MNRLDYYTITFFISLLIFAFQSTLGIVDTIIFVIFVISSLTLIFSRDTLPKESSLLDDKDIHKYYYSRNNLYSYLMVALFVVISIAYSTLSVFYNIRSGIVILILWFVAIILTYLITKFTQDFNRSKSFIDFLRRTFPESFNEDNQELTQNTINQLSKGIEPSSNSELQEKIIAQYKEYSPEKSSELKSSDIRAINDSSTGLRK